MSHPRSRAERLRIDPMDDAPDTEREHRPCTQAACWVVQQEFGPHCERCGPLLGAGMGCLEGSSTSETALTGPPIAGNAGYRKGGGGHGE